MRGKGPTTAALIDPWGRPHQVRRTTIVGRVHDEDELLILDATISRRHASLSLRGEQWVITDFGSSNGTYIEGVKIEGEAPLRDGERLRFGDVKFFFLDGVTAPPDVDTSSLGGFTMRLGGAVLPGRSVAPPAAKP